jgi:hypothetical protein
MVSFTIMREGHGHRKTSDAAIRHRYGRDQFQQKSLTQSGITISGYAP